MKKIFLAGFLGLFVSAPAMSAVTLKCEDVDGIRICVPEDWVKSWDSDKFDDGRNLMYDVHPQSGSKIFIRLRKAGEWSETPYKWATRMSRAIVKGPYTKDGEKSVWASGKWGDGTDGIDRFWLDVEPDGWAVRLDKGKVVSAESPNGIPRDTIVARRDWDDGRVALVQSMPYGEGPDNGNAELLSVLESITGQPGFVYVKPKVQVETEDPPSDN